MKKICRLKSNDTKAMYYGRGGLYAHKSYEIEYIKVTRPKRTIEILAATLKQ